MIHLVRIPRDNCPVLLRRFLLAQSVAYLIAVAMGLLPAGVATATTTSPNLIENGSFEAGSFGDEPFGFTTLSAGQTELLAWEVTGASIDWIGTRWRASDGDRSIDIAGTPGPGGIRQSFPTTPGQTYLVQFDLAGNSEGGESVKELRANVAGVAHDFAFDTTGRSPTDMGWETKRFQFTANSTSSVLEFLSLSPATSTPYFGAAIDNVIVSIPEPSSLGLTGFFIVGITARRRRHESMGLW